ncbi:hypothetical protein PAPYR_3220 [Paratrimastix pyriformis]|uniref:Uncharacterized protein n=1 Tax=Paratrimastix pyriformis TaxID=342808 RepID=A0ABQ8UN29_9EUKA|nr:hypothetical protein PAPYR_3220 [Paratrimastix pyriformis]
MDAELERYDRQREELLQEAANGRLNLAGMERELAAQQEAPPGPAEGLHPAGGGGRAACAGLLDEPEELKDLYRRLYHTYVARIESLVDLNSDVQIEYARQQRVQAAPEPEQGVASHRADIARIMHENVTLVKEINLLSRERRYQAWKLEGAPRPRSAAPRDRPIASSAPDVARPPLSPPALAKPASSLVDPRRVEGAASVAGRATDEDGLASGDEGLVLPPLPPPGSGGPGAPPGHCSSPPGAAALPETVRRELRIQQQRIAEMRAQIAALEKPSVPPASRPQAPLRHPQPTANPTPAAAAGPPVLSPPSARSPAAQSPGRTGGAAPGGALLGAAITRGLSSRGIR